jgi:hypothetical protein
MFFELSNTFIFVCVGCSPLFKRPFMNWQVVLLLFFFIVTRATIDARAIRQDAFDQLVSSYTDDRKEVLAPLANDQYLLRDSNNIKAFRSMFQQHIDPEEVSCRICHILLPIVSETFPSFLLYCSFTRCEYSSTSIKRNVSRMWCLQFATNSVWFSMSVAALCTNIK